MHIIGREGGEGMKPWKEALPIQSSDQPRLNPSPNGPSVEQLFAVIKAPSQLDLLRVQVHNLGTRLRRIMLAYCSKQHEGPWVFAILLKGHFGRYLIEKGKGSRRISCQSYVHNHTPAYTESSSIVPTIIRRFSGSYWWRTSGPFRGPVCI